MTGDFDAEARERELQAQQTKNGDTEEDGSDNEQVEETPDPSGGFYNKLVTLNEKIGVFQNQFYGRKPKRQITYEHLFKDKVKDFETFKLLYGYSEGGTRLIKIGNETLRVNNQEFSYNVMPENDHHHKEVVKRRLMQGTLSSQQRVGSQKSSQKGQKDNKDL